MSTGPVTETENVPLNLEETGHLCNLLMSQFIVYKMDVRHISKMSRHEQRLIALYHKLAAANDKLMGKT